MESQTLPLNSGFVDLWRAKVVGADGVEEELTHLEVGLLRYLAQRPGRPVPRHELLAEVWGYGKSVRTRAVDATVKRLRHKVERDPARPEHLRSAHGVGYAFFPASSPEPVAVVTPSGDTLGANVLSAIGAHRLVTLIGPIAVGKSWLAEQVGGRVGGRCVQVDVSGLCDAEDLTSAIRAGAEAAPSDDPRWLAALGPITLVLDNADAPAVASVVRHLLDTAPAARFLVTCRRALGLVEEQVVPVPRLGVEQGSALYRATVERLGRSVTDDDAVGRIVEGVDGLPGYILMAARRTAVQSERELAESLATDGPWPVASRESPGILHAFGRIPPPRMQTLQQLGCFAGDFSLPAAATVCDLTVSETLEHLDQLVASQWLVADLGTPTRYRLLRVAHAHLDDPDPATQDRYTEWVCEHIGTPGMAASELSRAADWAHGGRRLTLALALDVADSDTGLVTDREARLQRHLAACANASAAERLPVVRRIARLVGIRGDHLAATLWFERALELARRAESANDIAETSISLASAYRLTGRHADAVAAATEGLDIASELGNARAIGVGAWCLGTLARQDGDAREARQWFLRAIEAGTARGRGMALESLAILIRREAHTIAQPEQFFQRAVSELMSAGDPAASAHASGNLGCLYIDAQRIQDARAAFEYALDTGRRVGLTASVAFGRAGLDLCDALQGRRVPTKDPPECAMPLALTCHHLAQALQASASAEFGRTLGELKRAEVQAGSNTATSVRLARAVVSKVFAPERARELLALPGEGVLFDVLHPIAAALVAGETSRERVQDAGQRLRGPDRAVMGAVYLEVLSRVASAG